jgi:potassium-transporting ATPase KdpC subunit
MLAHLRRSLVLTVALLILCAVIYPLAGLAVSQGLFAHQADGSIGSNGSSLIGQPWNNGTSINPMWFNGRPDADNPFGLNGARGESGAASLGPRSEILVQSVRSLIAEWHAVGVDPTEDLVTTSGSGLDPDLAPADATVQIAMVARARHLSVAALTHLVHDETVGPEFGFLGASYVNVQTLNEALAVLVVNDHGVGPT